MISDDRVNNEIVTIRINLVGITVQVLLQHLINCSAIIAVFDGNNPYSEQTETNFEKYTIEVYVGIFYKEKYNQLSKWQIIITLTINLHKLSYFYLRF